MMPQVAYLEFETEAFSGPHVSLLDELGQVFTTQIINVFSLWQVLPDQAVGVSVSYWFRSNVISIY